MSNTNLVVTNGTELDVLEDIAKIARSKRTVHIILSLDRSPSMNGDKNKILGLNMPVLIEELKKAAETYGIDLIIRIKTFSTGAEWIVGNETYGIPIADVSWDSSLIHDTYNGLTNIDKSLAETGKCFDSKSVGGNKPKKPIEIILTDGHATCTDEELQNALQSVDSKKSNTRIVIGIGNDYDINQLNDIATDGTIRYVDPTNDSVTTTKGKLVFECKDISMLPAVINSVSTGSITNSSEDTVTINTNLWKQFQLS